MKTSHNTEYNSVNFNHSFAVSNTETDRKNFALGVSSFTANGELERMEYVGSATNLPGFDLVWGIDHEEASNNGVSRDNEGYFIEYLSEFSDNFFLTAGLRHDECSVPNPPICASMFADILSSTGRVLIFTTPPASAP